MADIVPPDYTTDLGMVRLLIPDTSSTGYIFSDSQITALLAMFPTSVKRAAAQAKDIIASDTVMLLKVIKTNDLQVDGAKVAAELRMQAMELRAQAQLEDTGDFFSLNYPADPVTDLFADARQWLWF